MIMGFAQHESFYIRSNWMTKALQNLSDPDYFSNITNHLELGIGKNMFRSLKYWAVATGVGKKTKDGSLVLSNLGEVIRQYDINCLQKDTLSILHYNLCSDSTRAETWYWFFNLYEGNKTPKDVLYYKAFLGWLEAREKTVSERSLKRDFDCFIQFYTAKENANDPEDTIYSPFASLRLISDVSEDGQSVIYKNRKNMESIGEGALMYVLIRYLQDHETRSVLLEDFVKKTNLWGRVFNMDRQAIAEALNTLSLNADNQLSFVRTNGLDMVYCELDDPIRYLKEFYEKEE